MKLFYKNAQSFKIQKCFHCWFELGFLFRASDLSRSQHNAIGTNRYRVGQVTRLTFFSVYPRSKRVFKNLSLGCRPHGPAFGHPIRLNQFLNGLSHGLPNCFLVNRTLSLTRIALHAYKEYIIKYIYNSVINNILNTIVGCSK